MRDRRKAVYAVLRGDSPFCPPAGRVRQLPPWNPYDRLPGTLPSEFAFEPLSPRFGPFLVLGLFDTNSAHLGHFGPFLGHIYYYTPLPLNLASNNKQQQATSNNKHVTMLYWPLLRPNASDLLPM